jgi:tetratricopeptide (TPR) repeat protein
MPSAEPIGRNILDRPLVHVVLIGIFALLVYSNTFNVPLQFDDFIWLSEEPAGEGSSYPTIIDFSYYIDPSKSDLLNPEMERHRYFRTRVTGYLSFLANYRLGGLDVRGYHAVNIAIHFINALLVYSLVSLTFRTPVFRASSLGKDSRHLAFFTALVFVTHPVQTEAVTYIMQRVVLLASLFYLLSIVAYIRFRTSDGGKSGLAFYAVSIVSALLANTSKEIAVTLPLALALYEFMFLEGPVKRRIVFLVPFLLPTLIVPFAYLNEGIQAGLPFTLEKATRLETDIPRADYLFTQFRVVATYIRLLFFPVNQSIFYDYPVYDSLKALPVLVSFVFLLGVIGSGVCILRRSRGRPELRLAAFGVFWFFLALSVESGLVPIAVTIAEYRVYLPSAGAIIAIASAVMFFASLDKRWSRRTVLAVFAALVVVFSVLGYARNSVWQDRVMLWEDTVRKGPGMAISRVNLGIIYDNRGMHEEAIREYKASIRISPGAALTHDKLGTLYEKLGQHEEAEIEYRAAIMADQNYENAYNNLGVLYIKTGRPEEAVDEFSKALKLKPEYSRTHYNLGVAYEKLGRNEAALREYQEALRIDPNSVLARLNLGVVYYRIGQYDQALGEFKAVLGKDPDLAEAHYNLGLLYARMGLMDDAISELETASRIKPEDKRFRDSLMRAYERRDMRDR